MTFLLMIIILGIMVIIHEAGHFIPAKIFGVKVPVFSIGYGKRLFGKEIRGTDYRLSLIPFGGYVKLQGMDPSDVSDNKDDFLNKPIWQRIIIIFSGPAANLIFAFLIVFSIMQFYGVSYIDNAPLREVGGIAKKYFQVDDKIIRVNNNEIKNFTDIYSYLEFGQENTFTVIRNDSLVVINFTIINPDSFIVFPILLPRVGDVVPGSPAFKAGLKRGDIIYSIDNVYIKSWMQISDNLKDKYEKEISLQIIRNKDTLMCNLIPEKFEAQDGDSVIISGKIGITLYSETYKPGFWESIELTHNRIKYISTSIIKFLGMLITRKMPLKMMGGPISIYTMVGENMKWGFDAILGFVSFFSLNLFIFNLIPFPPLDGSYILLYIVEFITRKRASKKFMIIYQQIGFFILMMLILLVSYNDILRLIHK